MNDFLSSTRTFELKAKVAALIREHDYPMVLNVVLHRLNIDHVDEILAMAERMGAQYVELANTQYYGWAWLNRDELLPSRAQLERAEAVTNAVSANASATGCRFFFVVPDYFETRPEALHERPGARCSSPSRPMARRCPATRRACCRASTLPNVRTRGRARDLVRVAGLQPLPRRALDEGAVRQLPGARQGLRRLPLPGVPADRRCPTTPTRCAICPRTITW